MSYDYEQTHKNIIKSAKLQFRERGFREASIRRICNHAGVTNGAFYAHFGSKEDLFGSIVQPCIDGLEKLYEDESESFLEINCSEDIIKAFRHAYTSAGKIIEYMCKNREYFLLILESGDGTVYESFQDKLAEGEAQSMSRFLLKSERFVKNKENISDSIIKMGATFLIATIFEGLKRGMNAEEISHETKLVSDYCIAGYKELLGI